MKKAYWVVLLFLLKLLFFACSGNERIEKEDKNKTQVVIRGEAQGTTYTVKYIGEPQKGVKEELDTLLKTVDQSMSTYKSTSLISSLNRGDTIEMDSMFIAVYELYQQVHHQTKGAFNPTLGPLIKAWGFDYANPQRMDSSLVQKLLEHSGTNKFKREGNYLWKEDSLARINFNAIAQGYAVDLMAETLEKRGIANFYVELGGELKVKGKNKFGKFWVIGIDQPIGENLDRKLANRFSLENSAMATSGNYRKFYELDGKRYSHTLNPKTGFPTENNLLSVTVVAKSCAKADAMATAFMVMGTEKTLAYLNEDYSVEAHLIYENNQGELERITSDGLKKCLLDD